MKMMAVSCESANMSDNPADGSSGWVFSRTSSKLMGRMPKETTPWLRRGRNKFCS